MADEDIRTYVPLGEVISQDVWPADVFGTANFDFLNSIAYVEGKIFDDEFGTNIELELEVMDELVFELPFGMALVVGTGPASFLLTGDDEQFGTFTTAAVFKLRLPRELFVPLIGDTDEPDPDPNRFIEIVFPFGLDYDSHGNIEIAWPGEQERTALKLERCMIGNTGVMIEADDVLVRLSDDETLPEAAITAGIGLDFRGVYIGLANVTLGEGFADVIPSGSSLTFKDCFIGTGGFTGRLKVEVGGSPHTELFGADFTFKSFTLQIDQNALTLFELAGAIKLDAFDTPLDVIVSVDLDGKLLIRVAQQGGLIQLGVAGVFKFVVDKIEFEVETDGDLLVRTSGTLTALFDPGFEVDWPGIRLENLEIDSDGNVRIEGGWIDIPEQATLDLGGFIIEITRIGFGKTDEGEKWIGFNGAVRIVQGIPAGASVEGVRILYGLGNTHLTVNGVGIDISIPNVIRISGSVSLGSAISGGTDPEFAGAVRVELPTLSFVVDGQFVAGSVVDPKTSRKIQSYGVFLQMQLPAGVPLGPTGLAFYGMAGLFTHNREPARQEGEGWYRNPDFTDGWFTRKTANPVGSQPVEGVTDLKNKWRPAEDAMGFGVGIIIGTFPDNGYMFNGRLLLVLSFPGPIILLEGMANLFKKRTSLGAGEPNFHTLIVVEPGKSFLAGLDAQYRFKDGGELMEIRGSAEAFFDYNNANGWFVNIGVDAPPQLRIACRIFQMFDVNGFFMLNHERLKVGAGWSYHHRYGWKHLNVTLSAGMEGQATVSWHPGHFTGSVSVQGSAELNAFSVHAGISVGATISGDVFDPFGLHGSFRASLNLPWPLPDIHKTISMSWERDFSTPNHPPPLPVPIREASIEHFKTHNSWPLVQGQSLLGDAGYNTGGHDFERPGDVEIGDVEFHPPAEIAGAPRIPADSKVAITFTRPINDPDMLTQNPVEVAPEVIGNPSTQHGAYTAAYTLTALELQKWAPGNDTGDGSFTWRAIRTGGEVPEGTEALIASWLPGTEQPELGYSEQHKLFVNAQTPFDYLADRSESWLDWFTRTHGGYPCPLLQPELSARFTQPIGTDISPSEKKFSFDNPAFSLSWAYGGDIVENEEIVSTVLGPIDRGLRMETLSSIKTPPGAVDILIRVGAPQISLIKLVDSEGVEVDYRGTFEDGNFPVGGAANPLTAGAFTFTSLEDRNAGSAPSDHNAIVALTGDRLGLDIDERLEIPIPAGQVYVELEFECVGSLAIDVEVFAVDADGGEGAHTLLVKGRSAIRLHSKDHPIAKVVIRRTTVDPRLFEAQRIQAALRRIELRPPVHLQVFRTLGSAVDVFEESDGMIRIHVEGITELQQQGTYPSHGYAILELALPGTNEELIRHTQSSLTSLRNPDPLFEPENDYRLVVTTVRGDVAKGSTPGFLNNSRTHVHHLHFHVVGPPGIGVPQLPPDQNVDSRQGDSLDDLRLYIAQTLPPTIPDAGDKLLLPRAFYRGCDVAVKFNENYGENLYLRARRDLSVRVYDVDNSPVRGPDGRVSIPAPSWEQSRQTALKETTALWMGMVNNSACRPEDLPPVSETEVPRDQTVSASGPDIVLAAETLHQARLVPALLHESFIDPMPSLIADGGGHRLERWVANGTSRWEIDFQTVTLPDPDDGSFDVFFAKETTEATSVLLYAGPLGAEDGPDAPHNWTDFRASAVVRWEAGIIGLDVRSTSTGQFIRLTLERDSVDPSSGTRRLVANLGGSPVELASDTTSFPDAQTDVPITVECVGTRVQVFQGLELVFDKTDAPMLNGTLGLYVQGATSPRFTEIRVDDLRDTPSTAFKFDFVTSKYTNFHHHLHSFPDQIFFDVPGTALSAADLNGAAGSAVAVPGASPDGLGVVTDAERRAFETLETKALGPEALTTPEGIEILRVSADGAPTALLVRSPEPFLWERTLLEVFATSDASTLDVPGDLKLTDVTFGTTEPVQESVTILVKKATSLANHRLEWRALPDPGTDPDWNLYFEFGPDEPALDDGIQVRVYASSPAEAPGREGGTVQKFVAPDTDHAELHFNVPGVELRLLAPGGKTVAHQRRFPTPDAFTSFPMQAVRKLDGTGLVLFTTATGTPPAGLRLRWTFNRAVGDEDLRFRQSGSETPEVAVLDFVLTTGV